jgi:hypothetical protein
MKYSAGPKASAKSARSGANVARSKTPTIPPTAEATTDIVNASPALPCRDIGYPSRMVAAADGVPGARMSMAGIEPA